jgi:predicted MFS family arabinose efflux permease
MPHAPTATDVRPSAPGWAGLPLAGLLALSAAAFTDVMTDLLPAGLLPQMATALHVKQAAIGYLVSAFAVASAVAAIPVTTMLRRVPRRLALSAALGGFAIFDAVTAVSSSYLLTFLARLLVGIAGGTLWSMLAGYAAKMVPAAHRGRAIAIVLAGITLALCLGVPAGTALAGAIGWRTSFAVLAVVALSLVAWVRWKVPAIPGEHTAARTAFRQVAGLPGVRAVLLVTLLLLTAHQATYTYIAPVAQRAGFDRISLVLLVFGVATMAGIWLTGILADRYLRSTLCGALAVIGVAMLGLGLAAGVPALLLIAVAAWGAAFGGAPTLLQTALIAASGADGADLATSMQTTVYNVGVAAGSLAGGLVLGRAGTGALPLVTMILVAGALVIVLAWRWRPGSPGHGALQSSAQQDGGWL